MPSPVTQSIGIVGTQLMMPQLSAQGAQATEAAKTAGITAPQVVAQAQRSATTAQNDAKRSVTPGRERAEGMFATQDRPDDDGGESSEAPDTRGMLAAAKGKGGRISTVG